MSIINLFSPNEILGKAFLALFFLSFLTAPVGCFLVWRRMSHFGSTLSNASLLGAICGLTLGIGVTSGLIIFTVIFALLLSYLLDDNHVASDAMLGMTEHLTLAVAIIAISLMDNLRIDLMSYLIGDVLSISLINIIIIFCFSLLGVVLLFFYWKVFLNLTVNKEIARAEGFSIARGEIVFTFLIATTISLGIQTTGVLLIISILIIPAVAARVLAKSAISMIVWSWIITVFSVFCGIVSSYYFNLPTAATIVCCMGVLFAVLKIIRIMV